MTCEGCASAIKRVIARLDDLDLTVDADVAAKLVVVRGEGALDARVAEALGKWGKAANKEVKPLAPAAAGGA